jgi:hypothetical protein
METVTHSSETQQQSNEQGPLTARQLFDLDTLEQLRQEQQAKRDEALRVSLDGGYEESTAHFFAANAVDLVTNDYVDRGTYDTDSTLTRDRAYESIRSLAIDRIPAEQWYAGPIDEQTGEEQPSGRDQARHLFEEATGEQYYAAPAAETEPQLDAEPAIEELRTEVNGLREQLAVLMAKRHSRIGGDGGEQYEELRQRYNERLIALGKLENEAIINDQTCDEADKKVLITKYLFDEQSKLHALTTEKLKGSKVGKFVEWMTRGKVATRIAKGLALGLGVGVVGATIGAVAGVAGVAAIGAGIATAAGTATRYARGFAMHFGKDGYSMKTATAEQSTEAIEAGGDDANAYVEKIHQYTDAATEQEVKRGQRETRMAVGAGALSIVLGAGVATAAHAAVDSGFFNGSGNRLFGGEAPSTGPNHDTVTPGHDAQAEADARAQAEADKAAADAKARQNVIVGSDTPEVADRIRDALGGGTGTGAEHGGDAGLFTGDLGTTTLTPGGLEGLSNWAEGYNVKSGDTVWGLAEQYLHAQGVNSPSVYQIDATKDVMLAKLQEHGMVSGNGWLQAGQRISLR